jgi:hypothetical protein
MKAAIANGLCRIAGYSTTTTHKLRACCVNPLPLDHYQPAPTVHILILETLIRFLDELDDFVFSVVFRLKLALTPSARERRRVPRLAANIRAPVSLPAQ